MKTLIGLMLAAGLILATAQNTRAADNKIKVVAAENFYGDIAQKIGGDLIEVASVMSNPNQDPHLFETTPSVVRQIADAQIVIYNGADYDGWMEKLLNATPRAERTVIIVANLVGKKAGDNPHLWYDPLTMPAAAKAMAAAFTKADGAHASDYAGRLAATLAAFERINKRVEQIRAKHSGETVTATEPVFGYMAAALKLKMRNERFQLAMMNDTEPSARDIAAFENDLKQHKVKVLLYNKQVTGNMTERLLKAAGNAKVPVVGITETQPAGMAIEDWMLGELNDLDKALSGPSR
ncbi:MAG TPA: zinc ABC transporter substrate-binding protein [Pseudolabrys sp.]|nr:zinc ABC transporter substrate-binding protein [Pseudolabrys sp.]